ncbi:hypothetical protein PG997_004810 [Apiospora hydei]|uniref:HMG box domain-containing protein n=1 Tax=Apiospora hydei TaxID=1337664 RepID=A0ABR1X3A0_9PEZI
MPSFIGRIAALRLAASAAATSSSRVVVAKQLGGRVSCPPQSSLPLLRAGFVRAYATPARPKKTDAGSSTQSAGRPRKTAAAAAAPKAAAKKAATTTTKKAAAAKKATKPKKKAASPPKPKKKELTEVQKAKKEKAKVREEKAELKQKALFTEPKNLPNNPWMLYVTRKSTGVTNFKENIGDRMATLSEEFKALSHADKEELQRTAEENKLQNAAAYKAWVESHTPEQIAEAQNARNTLRRKFDYPKANGTHKIRDDRQPKPPRTAWVYFFRARHGSGDFNSLSPTETLKEVAQEWKNLSTVDRQPFDDLAAADLTRYKKEVESTLHREIAPRDRETLLCFFRWTHC